MHATIRANYILAANAIPGHPVVKISYIYTGPRTFQVNTVHLGSDATLLGEHDYISTIRYHVGDDGPYRVTMQAWHSYYALLYIYGRDAYAWHQLPYPPRRHARL